MRNRERSCCFFGCIFVSDRLKPKLYDAVWSAIRDGYRIFYVGNHGGYDRDVLSILKAAESDYPEIVIKRMLSTPPGSTEESKRHDPNVICLGETDLSLQGRIKASVRKVAERCSLAICYVQEECGDLLSDILHSLRSSGVAVVNLMDAINYLDI